MERKKRQFDDMDGELAKYSRNLVMYEAGFEHWGFVGAIIIPRGIKVVLEISRT